ncbi:MAG: hypothetical protein M1837_000569 [Sclerophora amabilis]|nr:MAG: hypothetical protein M1837_000569 [Sclerophora amabilis]
MEYPTTGSYPYVPAPPTPSSTALSQMSNSYGSYSSGSNSSLVSLSPGTAPSSVYYNRVQNNQTYPSSQYSITPTKGYYQTAFPVGYTDEPNDACSSVSPHYMLPSHDSGNSRSNYGPQDSLRAWHPLGPNNKASNGGMFVDQESSSSYGSGSLAYLPASVAQLPPATTDSASLFPGMTSLVSSLPGSSPGGARVLPRPYQTQNGSFPDGTVEILPLGSQSTDQSVNFKPLQHSWGNDNSVGGNCQVPGGATSKAASSLMEIPGSKPPPEDPTYNFMPITTNTQSSTSTTSSMPYALSSLPNPITSQGSYLGSTTSIVPAGNSNGASSPTQDTSSNLYSYSTENGYKRHWKRDSSNAVGRPLANGETYTPPQPIQTQLSSPLDAMGRESAEVRPHSNHRSFVSSYSG